MVAKFSKKVCLLGDFAVGKTSLVRRFVYSIFEDKYISTIGVKVSRKTVTIPHSKDIVELTIMLWDLAGSQEFSQVQSSYLRGAAGAVLVCDLTRAKTLDSLRGYADDLLTVSPNARLILAANKQDLIQPNSAPSEHQLSEAQIEAIAAELNAPYYLTSAKTGEAVEILFRHLGRLLFV